MSKICRFLWLLVPALSISVSAIAADPDPRVIEAQQELKTSLQFLSEATNVVETSYWEKRVFLAGRELTNTVRFIETEQKEQSFQRRRKENIDFELRDALSEIAVDSDRAEQTAKSRSADVRRLKNVRETLEMRLREGREGDPERAETLRAELESQIRNVDAEMLARMFEHDAARLKVRLSQEANRVEDFRRNLERNPRPTIKLLLKKSQEFTDVEKASEELQLFKQDTGSKREETATAYQLAEERFGHLDEEIRMLEELLVVERSKRVRGDDKKEQKERQQKVNRMLQVARSEKLLMKERVGHLKTQLDALDESLGFIDQGVHLLQTELSFRSEDMDALSRRYRKRVLMPVLIIIGLIVGYMLISRLLLPIIYKTDALFVARRLGSYLLILLIIACLVSFFLEDLKAIATVMGIVGAAIVIALQDLCSSFAGWFVIVTSRKVKVGDRIEIEGHRGDVIDIQMLRTTLLEVNNWLGFDEPTGRVVVVPNSFIFKSHLFNYSHVHPFVWGVIDITVTFETPPQEAYDVLLKCLEAETKDEFESAERGGAEIAKRYGMTRTAYEPKMHSIIADSGVQYSLFYVAHFRRFSYVRDKINARILTEFENNPRLEFAYPTERHIPTADPTRVSLTVEDLKRGQS
ncbi:MAG: mechanosensitive ion channel [Verrucomicrobia bacterium]|nr:mechanosensitive ion channel [Verrucomicrobiota bacterium]